MQPENIMCTPSDANGHFDIKITDFGLSKVSFCTIIHLSQSRIPLTIAYASYNLTVGYLRYRGWQHLADDVDTLKEYVGTPLYAAPEV